MSGCGRLPAPRRQAGTGARRSKFAVPHSDFCLLFVAIFSDLFCSAFCFVAMRYARAKRAVPEVMHLFVGHKLEMKKPRGYAPRREFVTKFVALAHGFNRQLGTTYMDALGKVKGWIGGLTEIGLMLLALAIVAALLVGSNLPFFGNVTGNIMALVKSLGDAGLVGLIALGVILWLFSSRKMA